jgi:prepilin-type N-terminal cleavage/methylation domain-containing protein
MKDKYFIAVGRDRERRVYGRSCGFTLIELLLASMLSVVLMAGVLIVLSGISRDAKKIAAEPLNDGRAIFDLLQWDLTNARTMVQSSDGRTLVLIGHGSLAQGTLHVDGRLVRVTYSCRSRANSPCLVREQQYLDEPVRPARWAELVGTGIATISVIPAGAESSPPSPQTLADDTSELPAAVQAGQVMRVPSWVRVRLSGPSLNAEEQLCVK